MEIFKSPDLHHNVIITVGSDAWKLLKTLSKTYKIVECFLMKKKS